MQKKVLIIGGTGFIGSALGLALKRCGHHPITVTKKPLEDLTPHSTDIPLVRLGRYDEASFLQLLIETQPDEIHFLSGNPYPEYSVKDPYIDLLQTNLPVLCLLEAMKKSGFAGAFWFASSVAVYGQNCATPLREEGPCLPISSYGLSKVFTEQHLKLYSVQHGLCCGAYRLFSTYGPGLRRQMIYDIITKLKQSTSEIELFGCGTEARDLSYVEDQASAICRLSDKIKPHGDIYNLGSGVCHEVRTIVEIIRDLMGSSTTIKWNGQRRQFDGMRWQADISKLAALGISYPTTIQEGLRQTINWYLER